MGFPVDGGPSDLAGNCLLPALSINLSVVSSNLATDSASLPLGSQARLMDCMTWLVLFRAKRKSSRSQCVAGFSSKQARASGHGLGATHVTWHTRPMACAGHPRRDWIGRLHPAAWRCTQVPESGTRFSREVKLSSSGRPSHPPQQHSVSLCHCQRQCRVGACCCPGRGHHQCEFRDLLGQFRIFSQKTESRYRQGQPGKKKEKIKCRTGINGGAVSA